MTVPAIVFECLIWLSCLGVGAGAVYLLVILIREWRRGELW